MNTKIRLINLQPLSPSSEKLNKLLVNDQSVSRQNIQSQCLNYSLNEVNGVGFVKAEIPNDPYLVVQSWQQGDFVLPDQWYPNTFKFHLVGRALNDHQQSVAALVKSSLMEINLARFIEPIELDLSITTANIIVDSAVIGDMNVDLRVEQNMLILDLSISPFELSYRIESDLIRSSGTGVYEQIDMTSPLDLNRDGVTLSNPTLSLSPLQVNDRNIPGYLIDPMVEALKQEFENTILQAIKNVTLEVTRQLIEQFKPKIRLNLAAPIAQEVNLANISIQNGGLLFQYDTQIMAQRPVIAHQEHGALFAQATGEYFDQEQSMISVGSGLVNHIAFAAWDAGNFERLDYTRARLETLGLGRLEFPYSNLERALISLDLPPILKWKSDGPYLELAGVKLDLKINLSDDTQAFTVTHIPIHLVLDGEGIRLIPDLVRPIVIYPIMLSKLNFLAERVEVLKLIRIAMPNVIADVLGSLPLITVSPIDIYGLDGALVDTLRPKLQNIVRFDDHWKVAFELE